MRFCYRALYAANAAPLFRSPLRAKFWIAVYAAAFSLIAFPAVAAPITERERENCRADYKRYCKIHPLGSEALRACMSRSIRKLSRPCVDALVDAGEMTQAQANKLRKKPVHAQRSKHKPTHRRTRRK